ncbi:MAG: LptA/OstA family protein [Cyanobacteria bacterium J06638_20]
MRLHLLTHALTRPSTRPVTLGMAIALLTVIGGSTLSSLLPRDANAQTATPAEANQPLRLESDIQEANSITGVITARGNVRINYPARQIQATAVQAQYFSRERRIVLRGDVYVLQEGNSLRGEVITYLIDEGRFVAQPDRGEQVEAIYLVPDSELPETVPGAAPAPVDTFNPKPEFKGPESL